MCRLPKTIALRLRGAEPATALAPGEASRNDPQVAVWDIAVRLFHWLLVGTVLATLITGYLAPKSWLDIHVAFGTAIAVLIVFRLVWGFTGPTYARFASFVVGPRAVVRYLKTLLAGRAGRHVGHNPLGAAMIVALLLVLGLLVVTGAIALGGDLKQGPLASFTTFAIGSRATVVHAALAVGMLGLIGLHVAGVLIESYRTDENLVRSMLTGRKAVAGVRTGRATKPGRPRLAAVMLTVVAIIAVPLIVHAARLPGLGVPAAPLDTVYAQECGACHTAYHPSLARARTWRAIVAGLDDHFGDDASLGDPVAVRLLAYLTANSAEHWDTRAANGFRMTSVVEPLRITASPAWKRIHRDIPPAAFGAKAVGGKLNCASCHGDASSGWFAPQAIAIPKEKTTP
jgi:cytochrome b